MSKAEKDKPKVVTISIAKEVHKQAKFEATLQDKPLKQYIEELIIADIGKKKSTTSNKT